ncbi:hypothetical protein FJY71_02085, partial [candidate division WOR-3 bacterium]|nr:hypothetical protein [candidate division WOR-3 bacterium]
TVCGDDSINGDQYFRDGMSIKGRLYFVDLTSSGGGFVIGTDLTPLWDTVHLGRGLPDSIRPITQHSGSWRWYNNTGQYLIMDATTDNYCWQHKDFLNIMAAGNEASARTIGSPCLAKNVLTVGATGNGTSSNTIASFSSRGPTQDNRVKPNVMAPGVGLWSAYYTGANSYQSASGTSMATPATNGTVGLMRCYLREGYYPTGSPNPGNRIDYISSALLRSMAMASADPNVGSYVIPSFDIGWGRVNADSALHFTGDLRKLFIRDDTTGLSTGQYKEELFHVNSSIPLKVCLAWTDTAAAANANPTLINNLNLELIAPSGTYYRGNQYTSGQSTANPSTWDNTNVEECARVNSPQTGVWRIRVYGYNVFTTRQPYAFTITGDVSSTVPDVGVTRILAPGGTIDSTQSVTPACSVYNYGNTTAGYSVSMRVGAGYSNTAAVSGHAPGTARYVTFPAGSNWPRGSLAVRCSSMLAGDLVPRNDTLSGSVFVRVLDVATTVLSAPGGTVDSGTAVAPRATVQNAGNATVTFRARFDIAPGYVESVLVSNLAAGASQNLTFANWTAGQRGTWTTRCSTRLAGDMRTANDRQQGSVTVRVVDVATTAILSPPAAVDSNTTVAPQATVRNNGTVPATFRTRFTISDGYDDSALVTNLAAGASTQVNFPNWTARARGTWTTTCSTRLAGDLRTQNDRVIGQVSVAVPDVGTEALLAPGDTADSGLTVLPRARLRNYGTAGAAFDVRFSIADGYTSTLSLNLAAGQALDTAFDAWTPASRGPFLATCSTAYPADINPLNDARAQPVFVRVRDVELGRLVSPPETLATRDPVTPAAVVRNLGNTTVAFDVAFHISDGYSDVRGLPGLAPGESLVVDFAAWNPDWGRFFCVCSTGLAGDAIAANNLATRGVTVRPPWPLGWYEVTSMPPGARPVKDGGWLAVAGEGGLIYAARGNKTDDFFSYDALDSLWTPLTAIPGGAEARPPYKGSVGTCDNSGHVYATKGNGTVGFWRYSVDSLTWTQFPDVPLGPSGKKVKGGTDMVYVQEGDTGFVYLLKGYKQDFFRFNTVSGVWDTSLEPAPAGARPKWDKGSWLVVFPESPRDILFAHKAKYHELWPFDVAARAWGSTALPGMPLVGMMGKSKRSKDGGCAASYDGGLYALKGGNSQEFWRFDVDDAVWAELETMPSFGSTGKKKRVKAGGDLVAWGGGAFFALKGNKTDELWRYMAAPAVSRRPERRDGVQSRTVRPGLPALSVTPGIVTRGSALLRYSLPSASGARVRVFDVTGRCVLAGPPLAGRAGAVTLYLGRLAAGVYLVRLEAGSALAERRLVVQR